MSAAYVPHDFGSEAESIAQALQGKRSGAGFLACCPAHEDRHASLSITQSGDRVLLKCHAGCTQESVIAALQDQQFWIPRRTAAKPTPDKTLYVYNDEHGRPLHRTVRTAGKKFWQEHYKNGQWISGCGPRVVLYHLDELTTRRSEPVYIAEGEKDVDRLRSLGYLSTCNAMGAGKWRPEYSHVLTGREIVLFYDNDPATKKFAGQEHAQTIALSLIRARCRVRIVDLPEGKDISDFLSLGFRKADLDKLIQDAPHRDEKSVHAWRARFESTPLQSATDTGGSIQLPDTPAFALTEYGNAERLMRDCAGDARHCRAFKQWYVYDGTRYCPDTTGEMVRRAKKMIRSIPEEAAAHSQLATQLRRQASAESVSFEHKRALLEKLPRRTGRPISSPSGPSSPKRPLGSAMLLIWLGQSQGSPLNPSNLIPILGFSMCRTVSLTCARASYFLLLGSGSLQSWLRFATIQLRSVPPGLPS